MAPARATTALLALALLAAPPAPAQDADEHEASLNFFKYETHYGEILIPEFFHRAREKILDELNLPFLILPFSKLSYVYGIPRGIYHLIDSNLGRIDVVCIVQRLPSLLSVNLAREKFRFCQPSGNS